MPVHSEVLKSETHKRPDLPMTAPLYIRVLLQLAHKLENVKNGKVR